MAEKQLSAIISRNSPAGNVKIKAISNNKTFWLHKKKENSKKSPPPIPNKTNPSTTPKC